MKRPYFFHHKLGYKKNPFGALTREEWPEELITPAYYPQWLDQRLGYFALPDVPRVQFDPQVALYLFATFGSNIREAGYFLYGVWQNLTEPQIVTEQLLCSCYDDNVDKKSRTS